MFGLFMKVVDFPFGRTYAMLNGAVFSVCVLAIMAIYAVLRDKRKS